MHARKPVNRHFYRQGKSRVYLTPVDDILAVRYDRTAKAEVRKILRLLGQVREIESQQLYLVELSEGTNPTTAVKRLQPSIDKGTIEAVAPVLLDERSEMLHILIDEIIVRFKPTVAAKQRKQLEK